jgi:hypothetical protein
VGDFVGHRDDGAGERDGGAVGGRIASDPPPTRHHPTTPSAHDPIAPLRHRADAVARYRHSDRSGAGRWLLDAGAGGGGQQRRGPRVPLDHLARPRRAAGAAAEDTGADGAAGRGQPRPRLGSDRAAGDRARRRGPGRLLFLGRPHAVGRVGPPGRGGGGPHRRQRRGSTAGRRRRGGRRRRPGVGGRRPRLGRGLHPGAGPAGRRRGRAGPGGRGGRDRRRTGDGRRAGARRERGLDGDPVPRRRRGRCPPGLPGSGAGGRRDGHPPQPAL